MVAESGRGGPGLQLLMVDHAASGVGLGQGNAHLVVALKAQCPAEAEDRGLGHIALLGEGRDGEVLRFVGVLEQIIRYRPAGLGQLVLPLVQQIPKVDRHDLITPYKAGEPGSRCTVLTPVP